MSVKVHLLQSKLNYFPENLEAISEAKNEVFIKILSLIEVGRQKKLMKI